VILHLATLTLPLLLFGCTRTVTLQPRLIAHLPPTAEVPLAVGVHYSAEFRNYEHSYTPAARAYKAILPLGSASAALFKDLFPKVFKKVVWLESRVPEPGARAALAAIIEPKVESFSFYDLGFRGRRRRVGAPDTVGYRAVITYRFMLYTPEGKEIGSWTTKGVGYGYPGEGLFFPNSSPDREAAELALQDAEGKFVSAFEEVPEAKRWLMGLPLAEATVPETDQETGPAPDMSGTAIEGVYPGVLAVRADPYLDPERQKTALQRDLTKTPVVAIRLIVENKGQHRLLFEPADIGMELQDGSRLEPASASMVASWLTGFRRIPVIGVVGLFVDMGLRASEMKEREEHLVALRPKELARANVEEDQRLDGFVYFVVPARPEKFTLTVPVVDRQAAKRYVVRLPWTSFKPFDLKSAGGPSP